MKLFFVFLCLLLATLSLAATSLAKKKGSLSRSKQVEKNGGASDATIQSSRVAKKKFFRNRNGALKKRPKKRVGATKGVKKTSAGAGKSSQECSAAQCDCSKFVLSFFPKVLVELIGGYLEGFSVVFTRNWSAVYNLDSVAVDSERHYLITEQDVHASSHGDGVQMSIGIPDLSEYGYFHSSHDGRSLFFTGKTKEQVNIKSFKRTLRWLVQETGTKSLKSVTRESGETSFAGYGFILSANGKTLVSTLYDSMFDTETTSVYQIKEHGKAASASKKGDFDGHARAVSGDGNRILLWCEEKEQLEIHDISGDESHLVLKIYYPRTIHAGPYALNNDGSKAAFIDNKHKLYIVDVGKQKGSISVGQLAPIDIPNSVKGSKLIYDAKDRLYAFGDGNLWLVKYSKPEFISLEKTQVPQGYVIQSDEISPNGDYIALLIRSKGKNEKEEHQYQMVVKGEAKAMLMRLCRYGY